MSDFNKHIPKWGANFYYKNQLIDVSNTCTIDNFLFAFWVLSRIVPNFIEKMPKLNHRDTLVYIITNIENYDWNKAKKLWIINVMKNEIDLEKKSLSLFGSEHDQFLEFLKDFQCYKITQACSPDCSHNGKAIQEYSNKIFFKKIRNRISIYFGFFRNCVNCHSKINTNINFKNDPCFIFIESIHRGIFLDEIPLEVSIQNVIYTLLCSTIHKPGHFSSIFNINNCFYLVDDIEQNSTFLSKNDWKNIEVSQKSYLKGYNVSVSLYYRL
jgi:hypothetical protein